MWTLIFLAVLIGCDGLSTVDLGGGYFLSVGDSHHQYVYAKQEGRNRLVIDEQIVGHRVIGALVLVHRMVARSVDCYAANGKATIITHYSDQGEFWIIDTRMKKETGPLTHASFNTELRRLGVMDGSIVDRTDYRSNTPSIESDMARCVRIEPA